MSRLVMIGIGIALILLVAVQMVDLLQVNAIDDAATDDLLAPYADVMPGQSIEPFTPDWCATYEDIPQEGIRICSVRLDDGHFVSATIYVRNHIVQRVTFTPNTLSIGDLPMSWGRPTIVYDNGEYYARWESTDYTITVPLGVYEQLNYWLPVDFVSIEAK
jgi:hypothetical protein